MDIQATVSSIQSFSGLLPIAERAEVKLSYWGSRYVCVSGYEGTLNNIAALASRVIELLEQAKYEFSETERESGRLLAARVDKLYEDNSKLFKEASYFTISFCFIRGVISYILNCFVDNTASIRERWHGGVFQGNRDFYYYTQAQLQTVFGISPEEAKARGYLDDLENGIRRWFVVRESPSGP